MRRRAGISSLARRRARAAGRRLRRRVRGEPRVGDRLRDESRRRLRRLRNAVGRERGGRLTTGKRRRRNAGRDVLPARAGVVSRRQAHRVRQPARRTLAHLRHVGGRHGNEAAHVRQAQRCDTVVVSDGRRIVFSRDNTLSTMTPTGGDLRRVTSALGGGSVTPRGRRTVSGSRSCTAASTTREIWRVRARRQRPRAGDASRRGELRARMVGRRGPHRLLEQRERPALPDLRDRNGWEGPAAADVPARGVLRPLVVRRREDPDLRARRHRLHARARRGRARSPKGQTTAVRSGGLAALQALHRLSHRPAVGLGAPLSADGSPPEVASPGSRS